MKNFFLLISILLLGLVLRLYNLNFPTVGYHNMMENESLSMAQEMKRTGDFLHKRVYFYNAFEEDPVLKDNPQPPLVAYQILLAWRMFGENIWAPRLINIFFGVAGILLMYLISRLLFVGREPPFFCAILTAVMPLAVFFSRNIQAESPAFFFMLLATLFYLKFCSSGKIYHLLIGGVAIFFAWAYRFNFIVGILPVIFCFPFKKLCSEKRAFLKFLLAALLPFLLILGVLAFIRLSGMSEFHYRFCSWEAFQPSYWREHKDTILWYVTGENFTSLLSVLATWGVFLAFFRRKTLLDRYLMGWVLAAVVYAAAFSADLHQNNYAQMPFLAAVCLSCCATLLFIAEELKKSLKRDFLILLMIAASALSAFPVYRCLSRMHSTVFLGQDVAGETIEEFTQESERVFLFTHSQGYAIARYASRYAGWPVSLEEFKKDEQKYGIRFVCIYPGEYLANLRQSAPALYEYIQNTYRVREAGFLESSNRLGHLVLEKGNPENKTIETTLQALAGKIQPRSIYKILGKYIFYYAIRP